MSSEKKPNIISNFVVGRKYLLLVTGQFSMNDSADQYGIRARHGTTVFPGADGTYEPGTVESPQTFAFMAVHTAVSGEDIELQVNSQDGSMAIPTITSTLALSPKVTAALKDYLQRMQL